MSVPKTDAIAAAIRLLPQRYEPAFSVAKLVDYPGNPKDHDRGAITESMFTNGFYGALLVQDWPKAPKYILAGHGRKDTLVEQGVETVPALLVKCDPRTARRIVLVDNRTGQLGDFNLPALADFLADMADGDGLAGTGYDLDDLDDVKKQVDGSRPVQFTAYDENVPTQHRCPKCGYEWSGSAAPGAEKDAAE